MANPPNETVSFTPIEPIKSTIGAGRPRPKVSKVSTISFEELAGAKEREEKKAQYKIEIMFSKHRSSLPNKPSPLMLLIWESGKRLHGGGDQKMYWCGYNNCDMPFSSDNFAYMHCVCPHCHREMFLDPDSKRAHIRSLKRDNKDDAGVRAMPIVGGEKLARLNPPDLAKLLEKTWHQLKGDADIYLKYSPYEIRYDPLHETVADMTNLDRVRLQRKPLIYTSEAIHKDLVAGSNLRSRILAMITA